MLLLLLNDHYEVKPNNGRKVWTIFTFLIWYKRYFRFEEHVVAHREPMLVGAAN